MDTLKSNDIANIITNMCTVIIKNRDYLNELDGKLGDADFGTSICGGFQAVQQILPDLNTLAIGPSLGKTGMTLVKSMGGASGPLFGTIFMKAGKSVNDKSELGVQELADMLLAGLDGVKTLGKSKAGDKTLIDALEPATLEMAAAAKAGLSLEEALKAVRKAAADGVENTKNMVAARGRAHYVGERGLGHQDAGATAILMMFTVLEDYVKAR